MFRHKPCFKYRQVVAIFTFFLVVFGLVFLSSAIFFKNNIEHSIKLSYQWFKHNVNSQTGRLEYMYFPKSDTYSDTNNAIRQLVASWSIAKAQKFLKVNDLDQTITNTLNYYLKHDENSLSFEAGIILVLSQFDYPNRKKTITKYANHLVARQQADGSYLFNGKTKEVEYRAKGGISSGEVMLALMEAYLITKDPEYLKSVNKAFVFYRQYWRNVDRFFFVHWQTQALYKLYLANRNPEMPEFIFEMNDYVIDNYLAEGEFTINHITIMEGTIDAYLLAKQINNIEHIKKYKKVIDDVVKKTLDLQVNYFQSRLYKNPKRVLGGFFFSRNDSSQLIDFTFHPTNALVKASLLY